MPSDDLLNSLVDSNGVARVTELDLGQPVASLMNSRRFRVETEERPSSSAARRGSEQPRSRKKPASGFSIPGSGLL